MKMYTDLPTELLFAISWRIFNPRLFNFVESEATKESEWPTASEELKVKVSTESVSLRRRKGISWVLKIYQNVLEDAKNTPGLSFLSNRQENVRDESNRLKGLTITVHALQSLLRVPLKKSCSFLRFCVDGQHAVKYPSFQSEHEWHQIIFTH